MTLRFLAGLLACLLLCACASQPAPQQWDTRVIRGELANGLRYNLIPLSGEAGRVDVRLTVHAGSVDESDEQVGVAHMVEHLTFYSHGEHAEDVRARLQAAGFQQGRHFNAVTNYDRTQYLLSPPRGKAQLELALDALATQAFAVDYQGEDLERERPVVIEEWRGGLGVAERMNGLRLASQRVGSRYPEHRTIGNRKAIEHASLQQLKAFQQRWYQPAAMVLNIVGDFDVEQVKTLIEEHFGAFSSQPLPSREHLELPLDEHLKVFRVQDSQSGANRVVMLWRLHEPDSRRNDSLGVRERLIERMTLSLFNQQLRRQPLADQVTSLTAVKTQIGRRSSVFGLAASLQGEAHEQGLATLLRETARVRQHGFATQDVEAERAKLRKTAEGMLKKDSSPDFADWVRRLNDATLGERPLQHPHEVARLILSALHSIDGDDLAERLRRWTDSSDRVLQVSAPGTQPVALPAPQAVEELWKKVAAEPLAAPEPPPIEAKLQPQSPPPPTHSGSVVVEHSYAPLHVQYWTLGNGDRLVWLKRNDADGRARLVAESAAGYADARIPAWQVQFASQLAAQAQPAFWSAAEQKAWMAQADVRLSVDQKPRYLRTEGSVPVAGLAHLLSLYRLSQTQLVLDKAAFQQARDALQESLARRQDNLRSEQDRLWQQLKSGQPSMPLPDRAALAAFTAEAIEALWQRQTRAPVTYYLMADVEPDALRALVSQELAGIARGEAPVLASDERRPGKRQARLENALEPRANLHAASFMAHRWSPEDAVRIVYLRELARDALKARLRGEAAGVYRLDFDAELSPREQRIVSELRFSTAPARLEELWQLAERTLEALPEQISEADLEPMRQRLRLAEAQRLEDPDTQLQRLILSDQAWGDPRYLQTQHELVAALDLPAMRALARQLFPASNRVILRVVPDAGQRP